MVAASGERPGLPLGACCSSHQCRYSSRRWSATGFARRHHRRHGRAGRGTGAPGVHVAAMGRAHPDRHVHDRSHRRQRQLPRRLGPARDGLVGSPLRYSTAGKGGFVRRCRSLGEVCAVAAPSPRSRLVLTAQLTANSFGSGWTAVDGGGAFPLFRGGFVDRGGRGWTPWRWSTRRRSEVRILYAPPL